MNWRTFLDTQTSAAHKKQNIELVGGGAGLWESQLVLLPEEAKAPRSTLELVRPRVLRAPMSPERRM